MHSVYLSSEEKSCLALPSSPSQSAQQSASDKTSDYSADFFMGCFGFCLGGCVYSVIAVPVTLIGLGATLLLGAPTATVATATLSLFLLITAFGAGYGCWKGMTGNIFLPSYCGC